MICGGTVPGVPLELICSVLSQIAPLRLAEEWDNVGLLLGDRKREVARVMTCLTITPDLVDEAIDSKVGLIVSHHPLPFKPVAKITTDQLPTAMLLRLASNDIAVYSAHTAFDSSASGINQQWAEMIGLTSIEPLIPLEPGNRDLREGSGRLGRLSLSKCASEIISEAARAVGMPNPRIVHGATTEVTRVAIACGSGGSFLSAAKRTGCELLLTGEATFHTCLEARSMGITLGLLGHFASERFAMERLAERLAEEVDGIEAWASKNECDPIATIE